MSSHHFLFIINTLSGNSRNRTDIVRRIQNGFSDAKIFIIQKKEDFNLAIQECSKEIYQYIIINGGDGTINTFLPLIVQQKKILGIIPSGSGNGLARSLNIPLNDIDALQCLLNHKITEVDVAGCRIFFEDKIIERYFACAMGLGVDAYAAVRFEKQKIRGLWGYIYAVMYSLFNYEYIKAIIIIDNKIKIAEAKYVLFSVMNIPQYGNDFYLAPSAKFNDGFLNVVLLKKHHWLMYFYAFLNFIRKKEQSPVCYYLCKNVEIYLSKKTDNLYIHIDGEPIQVANQLKLQIYVIPSALKVLGG